MDKRITARDLIREIARNMQEGLEPLEYTILAPNHYDVYLEAADYRALEPLFGEIRHEANQKLDEELERLNTSADRSGFPLPWRKRDEGSKRYERKGRGWEITFCVDHEPGVQPGDVTIHSYFTVPHAADYGAGSRTKRIVTRKAGTETELVSVSYEDAPAAPEAAAAPNGVLARIRFTDGEGEHVYEMKKEAIVIGRRDDEGQGYWADVRLDTRPDVSREHVRLRRDPGTGRFEIKDLSRFGTAVNGAVIPSSIQLVSGERKDLDRWVPLPDRSEIELSGIITLHFEAVG